MNREVVLALNYALSHGVQIHPDVLAALEKTGSSAQEIIKNIIRGRHGREASMIGMEDFNLYFGIEDDASLPVSFEVVWDPTSSITSSEGVEGYSELFVDRYERLKKIIQGRPESKKLKSVAAVRARDFEGDVCLCGLVVERNVERNFTKLVIDDPTGSIEVMVFNEELREVADSMLNDQFVMIVVYWGRNGGFMVKNLIIPDVPERRIARTEREVYALFLSDLHIGSRYFMETEFRKFLAWLSGPDPVAKKVGFVLIGGDIVDGVGIYPNQDKELLCKTVEEQFEKTTELLSEIPERVRVCIIPGNHDPGRRALPQPAVPEKYCPALWERENVTMVGNPAVVSLGGVKVLMFHGQSIDDLVKAAPGLSYDRPVDAMRHLLRARHLSPVFGGRTPIAPETEDLMVVNDVPDVFQAGHVHVVGAEMYRSVTLINSGAWQKQTPFQASVGQVPTPGVVVMMNLKTGDVGYKYFG